MKYIGIDFGAKKIGVAVSDEEGILAFPAYTAPNNVDFLADLKEYSKGILAESVVLGASVNALGEENPVMKEIRSFAVSIERALDLPVYFEKEWLSSVEARRFQNDRREADDAAAAIILQRYLDRVSISRKKLAQKTKAEDEENDGKAIEVEENED